MGREPLRTCVGCRRVRPKAQMVRLARRADGTVVVDRAEREPGRGAYVCPGCGDRARRRLAGALRVDRVDFESIGRALNMMRAPAGAR